MATNQVATRGRARGAWRRVARALTIAGATLLLCALGIVLGLNTPFARTLVANWVNQSLSGYFCGQVTVTNIESFGLSGIRGISVSVEDPEGNRVLSLRALDARLALLPTLREVLLNQKTLSLTIAELSLDQLRLVMQSDAANSFNLQRAFRVCAPPTPSTRRVRLAIRKARIAHLLAHVDVLGVPAFDAELKDLGASLILIPGKLAIDVDHFSLETRGLVHGADLDGSGRVKFVLPLSSPHDLLARVHWAGSIYGTEVAAEMQWLAGLLRLSVDAPRTATTTIRRFWSVFPAGPDVSVHAELQGTPPEFALRAQLARGASALDVRGHVQLGVQKRADLHLTADSLDFRELIPRAVKTSISGSVDITAQQAPSGSLSGELRLELPSNSVAGVSTPPMSIQASFLHVPDTLSNLEGRIIAHEAGAPTQLLVRLKSTGKGTELTFEGGSHAEHLDHLPRLGQLARGTATVKLMGSVDLSRSTVNAKLGFDASELRRGKLYIAQTDVQATLRGPLKAPHIDVDLNARRLEIGAARFSEGHATAHGPLASTRFAATLRATDGADLNLSGLLSIDETLTVRDLMASFNRGAGSVKISAKALRLRNGGVAMDHARIEGLGEPLELSLALAPRELRVRALGKGLDLSQLARITQLRNYSGTLDLDLDLTLQPGHADGRVALNLNHAQVGPLSGWSLQAEARLQNRDFSAQLRSEVGESNWLGLQTESIKLDGPADEPESWQRWSGWVGIDARFDLAQLAKKLPASLLALQEAQGTLSLRGKIAHESTRGARPSVNLLLEASQLGFSLSRLRSPNAKTELGPQFRNLRASASFDYDGAADQSRAHGEVRDRNGVITTLDVAAEAVPYAELVSSPDRLQQLEAIPFTARLQIPRRSLKDLPGDLVPNRYLGSLESELLWTGTLAHPDASLDSKLTQLRIPGSGISKPLDLALVAHYDGERANGDLKVTLDERLVLETQARVEHRVADWLTRRRDSIPWEASARARLIAFPLERIRRLGNSEVRGTLNGEFELEGLHRDARANLRLETQQLRIRDLVLTAGSAQVVVRPGSFDARVRLEESPAFAEARLSGASTWGESLVPVIDDSRALRAGLSASRFRIATLLPFAGGVFSDLDGRLDSEMSAEIDRRARTTRLSGVAALKGGVFELAAGGGEFHDVDAKLVLKPDGTVQLESMTAQGVNGRLRLTASARFDGLGWASSEAHLLIPANSPIPLTLEGAGYGTVFGQIDLLAVRAPNQRDVLMDIDVPTLNVMLPATSTRTVRQLEPMKDVRLGSRQSGDQFVPLPTRRRTAQASVETPEIPAQVKISLNLGKEIKVTRGNSLEVTLTGRPQLVLTNSVDVSGQLQLLRGFLDIEGKRFEIEQGTVSFVGKDPTNPQADVTATWTAPDGTIVYAEFSGPLRTGRVTLRSDPPLPSNEILALMLFGGTDLLSGSSSSQARASGSNVIGVAQGAATQPINHALQDYGLGGVSTRVDTSAVNPRPEVEVRIARDIALQIAWVLGTPPPGSNPDRTLFTIDWQFFRRWSLETTVGDAGTSIADVIWQYGY